MRRAVIGSGCVAVMTILLMPVYALWLGWTTNASTAQWVTLPASTARQIAQPTSALLANTHDMVVVLADPQQLQGARASLNSPDRTPALGQPTPTANQQPPCDHATGGCASWVIGTDDAATPDEDTDVLATGVYHFGEPRPRLFEAAWYLMAAAEIGCCTWLVAHCLRDAPTGGGHARVSSNVG